jgi:hypothetical protein
MVRVAMATAMVRVRIMIILLRAFVIDVLTVRGTA